MSYTITAEVEQTNTNAFFPVVEQTVWKYAKGGTWDEVKGAYLLTMGGSGTSGSLRFVSDTGENFIITLGIDGYKRWGNIVTNLTSDQTGVIITPEYCSAEHPNREKRRVAYLTTYSVKNSKGRSFSYTYTVADGNNLVVKIVIG